MVSREYCSIPTSERIVPSHEEEIYSPSGRKVGDGSSGPSWRGPADGRAARQLDAVQCYHLLFPALFTVVWLFGMHERYQQGCEQKTPLAKSFSPSRTNDASCSSRNSHPTRKVCPARSVTSTNCRSPVRLLRMRQALWRTAEEMRKLSSRSLLQQRVSSGTLGRRRRATMRADQTPPQHP